MEDETKKIQLVHCVIDELEASLKEERRKVALLKETMRDVLIIAKNGRHRNAIINRAVKALAESEHRFNDMNATDQRRLLHFYLSLQRPD